MPLHELAATSRELSGVAYGSEDRSVRICDMQFSVTQCPTGAPNHCVLIDENSIFILRDRGPANPDAPSRFAERMSVAESERREECFATRAALCASACYSYFEPMHMEPTR
jgi:hypothetical protein